MSAPLLFIIAGILSLHMTAALPPGYDLEPWAAIPKAIDLEPVTMEDGSTTLLAVSQTGLIHAFWNPDTSTEYTTIFDISSRVCSNGERGLLSVVVHPNFSQDEHHRFLYAYYSHRNEFDENGCLYDFQTGPRDRLSRFTVNSDWTIDLESELVFFQTPPQGTGEHNGGDLAFGKDGLLYVSVGDDGSRPNTEGQDMSTLNGKLLRFDDHGHVPASNPYVEYPNAVSCRDEGEASSSSVICREILASGIRNSFRIQVNNNAVGTQIWMMDVGRASWEEINQCGDGTTLDPVDCHAANFGWMEREGPCDFGSVTEGCDPISDVRDKGFTDPVHYYTHRKRDFGGGAAVVGGDWPPTGHWPLPPHSFIFADFVFGELFLLYPDPEGGCRECRPPISPWKNETFHDLNGARAITLKFVPHLDGTALYFTCKRCGSETVQRITYVGGDNTPPVAVLDTSPKTGASTTVFQFDASRSYDPDSKALTYHWDFGDGTTSNLERPTKKFGSSGNKLVKLTVVSETGFHDQTEVTLVVGALPTLFIDDPAPGTTFHVGDVLILRGRAFDADGTPLPDESLTWEVQRHHNTHYHEWLEPTKGNDLAVRPAPRPEDFLSATNSFLKVLLTATSSDNVAKTIERDVMPELVYITFQSFPSQGYEIEIDGFAITTPTTAIFWVNEVPQLVATDSVPGLFFVDWTGTSDSSRLQGAGQQVALPILAADNNTVVTIHVESMPSPIPSLLPSQSPSTSNPAGLSNFVLLSRLDHLFIGGPVVVGDLILELEPNGNLILLQSGEILWETNTRGPHDTYYLKLQGDCNLVLRRGTPENKQGVIWKTNQRDTAAKSCFFGASFSDESVSVYRGPNLEDGSIWTGNMLRVGPPAVPSQIPSPVPFQTPAPNSEIPFVVLLDWRIPIFNGESTTIGRFTLELENDGNLRVVYSGFGVVWETGIRGAQDGYFLRLQGDCNLIVRQGTPANKGDVLWKSRTSHPDADGCFLAVSQQEGSLSIYRGRPNKFDGGVYWTEDINLPATSQGQESIVAASEVPSVPPSEGPTNNPSDLSTNSPSRGPTASPSFGPTDKPSETPSNSPTDELTDRPSQTPTEAPSQGPTNSPTVVPSFLPSLYPTLSPSDSLTGMPSEGPTASPSHVVSNNPSQIPSDSPSMRPTNKPNDTATRYPTRFPTESPSRGPSVRPTTNSSITPSS